MNTIFVSSTFKDMQEERDLLQERVAPVLNQKASPYGKAISFCDLRWGVNTADLDTDEGSRKVLDVCLDTIDRCQPPMVVILGYRYGWIPDERLIENAAKRKQMMLDDLKKSVTALEIEYGAFVRNPERTLFYFREIESDYPDRYGVENDESEQKLKELKDKIVELTNGKVKTYKVKWNGERFEGLDVFAKMVEEDITALLMPEWEKEGELTPFARERLNQESFIAEKSGLFRARKTFASEMVSALESTKKLVIKGKAGMGKSTLFSYLVGEYRKQGYDVLPFVGGLTQESNDAMDIVKNTVYYLEEKLGYSSHYGEEKDERGESKRHTVDEWREKYAELCSLYGRKQKFLVMVDALDQLFDDENREKAIFVPYTLSENVKIVMTCLTDYPIEGIELRPLEEEEKRMVVAGTLAGVERELDRTVIEEIVSAKASENPLFISLLVQRLLLLNREDFAVMLDSRTIVEHQIKVIKDCPDDLEELSVEIFRQVGRRLGSRLIQEIGEYIAVSRYGLRPSDLARLTGNLWSELDFVTFVYLVRESFQIRPDGRYDYTHKSIRNGFLKQVDRQEKEKSLAEHFKALPDDDPVKMREITYHLIKSDDKQGFVDYVTEHYWNETLKNYSAKDTYDVCLFDGGAWLCTLLEDGLQYTKNWYLNGFINYYLIERFEKSMKELLIAQRIMESNVAFAEQYHKEYNSDGSKRELSASYNNVAGIYQAFGGRENLEKALELYQRCLELFEGLAKELGTADAKRNRSVSYDNVAGIYKAFGGRENLEKALELYERCLELFEGLAKELGTAGAKRDLSLSYERIAGIYEAFGGRENLEKALELYQQGLELSEGLAKELGTVEAYDDLIVSYYNLGSNSLVAKEDRKNYLAQAINLCKRLYEITKIEKYAEWLQIMVRVFWDLVE